MIEAIHNSPNEFSVQEAGVIDAFSKKQTENKGNENNPADDKNSNDYELSLTDNGWEVLNGKADEEDEKKRDADGKEELSEEDQRKVDELEKIDRKVRTHEQAHLSAAGGYARGGANYSLVTGPDGKRYANAGHVNIDTSPERTPEATIRKAETVRKAALAPADPSPSDRQIAADATKMAQDAQKELAAKQGDES